jgi:hypothetical protein
VERGGLLYLGERALHGRDGAVGARRDGRHVLAAVVDEEADELVDVVVVDHRLQALERLLHHLVQRVQHVGVVAQQLPARLLVPTYTSEGGRGVGERVREGK